MANRLRDIRAVSVDQENLHNKPLIKPQLTKQQSLRRPALNELDSKLNGPKNLPKKVELKKKPSIKEPALAKKKGTTTTQCLSSTQLEPIVDPDADNKNDPQMVAEYIIDIYVYLREQEAKYPIREKFLEGHKSCPRMRAILVDWLVQVHSNFKLCLETLYLCVAIIDRYLQDHPSVGRETLQLVGTAALWVACKYEEMYVPGLHEFMYICDDTFTGRQIKRMEIKILKALDFSVGRPVSITFLRRYSKIAQVKMEQHTLAKYILELALLEHNFSHIKPSLQAAAACCLAISILREVNCPSKVWTPTLVHYTTYTYPQIKNVVIKFASMLLQSADSKNQAIQGKYSAAAFCKISTDSRLKGPLVRRLAETTPTKP